ncbi:hypothetical protein E2320_008836 [Naja naja]|nr:hypothetical protein E2320_008836 [Naja naja]
MSLAYLRNLRSSFHVLFPRVWPIACIWGAGLLLSRLRHIPNNLTISCMLERLSNHIAKATAQIGNPSSTPVEPSGPHVLDKAEFSEPVIMQENIPCPSFFLEVVQRQWSQPGTFSN